MKCLTNDCPVYFESDNRGSCKLLNYCDKNTECPIEDEVGKSMGIALHLLELREIIYNKDKWR